jgi:hypothetical protein
MKKAIFFAFALLLPACHEEPTMSFGIHLKYRDSSSPSVPENDDCHPPGSYGVGSGASIDNWEIGEPPPHLFLEVNPDAERDVYNVRVFSSLMRDEDAVWWTPDELFAERTYDRAFGDSGGQDSFVVDFDGEQYTVEVQGLPPAAACP